MKRTDIKISWDKDPECNEAIIAKLETGQGTGRVLEVKHDDDTSSFCWSATPLNGSTLICGGADTLEEAKKEAEECIREEADPKEEAQMKAYLNGVFDRAFPQE